MNGLDPAKKLRILSVSPSQAQLWDRFRNGDREALGSLYRQYIDDLYHYGMHFCRDEERVKDCLQDLFRDMWAERDHISAEIHNVRYYLLSSLRRRLLRSLQKDRRHKNRIIAHSFDLEFTQPQESTIIKNESSQEKAIKVHKAIALLSRRQREVIYLRFFQELSYAEIAQLMSLQVDSVYNLISKAIGLLKKSMAMLLILL